MILTLVNSSYVIAGHTPVLSSSGCVRRLRNSRLSVSCRNPPEAATSICIARGSLSVSGTIILLNGTVSAGKTSLARAVQHVMAAPYLHLGADFLGAMCAPRYAG